MIEPIAVDDAKAPVIDLFNVMFFKKIWHIIKQDVYSGLLEFFDKSRLHKRINTTLITLVPKVSQALFVKDFRSITCCTIVYMIISKIITHRMQSIIHEVVNPSQAGFIHDRFIADNSLLATELISGYSRNHVSPRCVIKVDIKKGL